MGLLAIRRPLLGRSGGDLLSHALRRSTIGAEGFHGRVRDGIGWGTLAITTRSSKGTSTRRPKRAERQCLSWGVTFVSAHAPGLSIRMEVTVKSIEQLVQVSYTYYYASTPCLSTWSSSTALKGELGFEGGFPLRCFQRLSCPYLATLLCHWRDNRSTRDTSIPVLSY